MSDPQNHPPPFRHLLESDPGLPEPENGDAISDRDGEESPSRPNSAPVHYLGWVAGLAAVVAMVMFGNGSGAIAIFKTVLALFCAALSLRYPRWGLWGLLIYLPFAGTIIYWIGDDRPIFHLAKDFLFYIPALLGLFLGLIRDKRPIIIPKTLKWPLALLAAIALLTLIFVNGAQQLSSTPGGQPLWMGLFGLKILLGYIPLITCGYYLIRNTKDFYFFTRLQVVLAIVCCILGIVQFWLVVSGICPDNTGLEDHLLLKANLQRKCLVGGALGYFPAENFIRLPGTFVAPWQWAWFLIAGTFFSFATALGDPRIWWRMSGIFSLALIVLNAVICGQRTAFLGVLLAIGLLVVATSHISRWKRMAIVLVAMGIFLGASLAVFPNFAEDRVESLIGRWQASPPIEFVKGQAKWTIKTHRGLLGNGLGRGTNAARALGETRLIETYYSKLLYEIGPIGVVAFLAVVTTLAVEGFNSYHQIDDRHLWSYAVVFWVFIVLIGYNPYWYPLDTDPVAVYYWFVAGVLFKLPEIERHERDNN